MSLIKKITDIVRKLLKNKFICPILVCVAIGIAYKCYKRREQFENEHFEGDVIQSTPALNRAVAEAKEQLEKAKKDAERKKAQAERKRFEESVKKQAVISLKKLLSNIRITLDESEYKNKKDEKKDKKNKKNVN